MPRVLICGDHLSGKTSVLQAVSSVGFPRRSRGTRFTTELVFRKTSIPGFTVTAVPFHLHGPPNLPGGHNFHQSGVLLEELSAIIPSASFSLGIADDSSDHAPRGLLRIEVSGPDQPDLSFLDLAGPLRFDNGQTASENNFMSERVKAFIQPGCIILAVVSAVDPVANQKILGIAREVAPKGVRTLGVIAKPDRLIRGSTQETDCLSLARNVTIKSLVRTLNPLSTAELGWRDQEYTVTLKLEEMKIPVNGDESTGDRHQPHAFRYMMIHFLAQPKNFLSPWRYFTCFSIF